MRQLLFIVVVLEALALAGGAGVILVEGDRLQRRPPVAPVFRPPVYEAERGEFVRFRREHPETGEVLGYLDYRIELAVEYEGTNFGREFVIDVVERNSGGGQRARKMRVRPRSNEHGFLPPRIDEPERAEVPGALPVIRSIRTAPVAFLGKERPGFLVEAVVPRDGIDGPVTRYWMCEAVPVFGVARIEREDEVLILHRMEEGPE